MTGNLPDLDEAISFTVDDGAQAGPFTMRTIIDSIRMGERVPTTLVWWAGEPEWVSFSSVPQLMDLLQGLPATNQPPPPGGPGEAPAEGESIDVAPDDEPAVTYEPTDSAAEVTETFEPAHTVAEGPATRAGEFGSGGDTAGDTARDTVDDTADDTVSVDIAEPAATVAGGLDALDHVPSARDDAAEAPATEPGGDWFDSVIGGADDSVNDIADGGLLAKELGVDGPEDAEVEWAPETQPLDIVDGVESAGTEEVESAEDSGEQEVEEAAAPGGHLHVVDSTDDGELGAFVEPEVVEVGPLDEVEPSVVDEPSEEPAPSVEQPDAVDSIENIDPRQGLFGAGAGAASREPQHAGSFSGPTAVPEPESPGAEADSGESEVPDALVSESPGDEEPSEPSPLESYEARIQALGTDSPIVQAAAGDDFAVGESDSHLALVEDVLDGGVSDEGVSDEIQEGSVDGHEVDEEVGAAEVAAHAAVPVDDEAAADTEALEAHFAEMVTRSWAHHKRLEFAERLDDVLLGALITSTLDNGYALIDIASDGSNHFVRFEHPDDGSRVTMGIDHLTRSAAEGEVLGHHASVVIGWGQRVADASTAVSAVKDEVKSGMLRTPEPGTVSVEADVASGYAYTQVDLIWAIEDFVSPDYSVDHAGLSHSVASAVHALRKYWYGRFAPVQD